MGFFFEKWLFRVVHLGEEGRNSSSIVSTSHYSSVCHILFHWHFQVACVWALNEFCFRIDGEVQKQEETGTQCGSKLKHVRLWLWLAGVHPELISAAMAVEAGNAEKIRRGALDLGPLGFARVLPIDPAPIYGAFNFVRIRCSHLFFKRRGASPIGQSPFQDHSQPKSLKRF